MFPRPFQAGHPRPLGAHASEGGVNFALFVDGATAVELLLYASPESEQPAQVIRLEHRQHRTVRTWHVFVTGVEPGQCYAWRVDGPADSVRGRRFDPRVALLDPYAQLIVPRGPEAAPQPLRGAMRSGRFVSVVPQRGAPPEPLTRRIRPTERIIYEVHLAGYTRHPSSSSPYGGTFAGLRDRIPYLVELGVTTVELMPVFAFDPLAPVVRDPFTGESLRDFWGYNPIALFAPHPYYGTHTSADRSVADELRGLVSDLHRAGIEVFLDVVYNHTGEGSLSGPTHSFRGISNHIYYIHRKDGSGQYSDFSGCGNTLNGNHPAVRRMILDSLRHWTTSFGIDGFRFDLASVLSRDEDGVPLEEPPLLWEIEGDPTMEACTLIAEAWDAAGLYQVGRFPGERWCEWNGRFRDDVRQFWRGDTGMTGQMASRVLGSPDLYEEQGRLPSQCVNFVTCHDGFTLADLVAFSTKRNLANGESGRDGNDNEHAFNCGVDGPTEDPDVVALRARQVRNLLATLFVSQGTPMLLAGDELGRSQGGNNNAWCQDNPVSWLDWTLLEKNADLHRFVQLMIRFRRAHHSLHRSRYLLSHDAPSGHDTPGYTRVRWHGVLPDHPSWDASNRLLCWTLTEASDDSAIHIMLNASAQRVDVVLPPTAQGRVWLRSVDTARMAPDDIVEVGQERPVGGAVYPVQARSAVVLIERSAASTEPARATQAIVMPRGLF